MESYIYNFKAYEEPLLKQQDIVEWLVQYHGEENRKTFDRFAVKPDYIKTRQVFSNGILSSKSDAEKLYCFSEDSRPSLDVRSEHAQTKMCEILESLYDDEEVAPTHLNHVSCSHYQSPSAPQKTVVNKRWNKKTSVTHLYHMGCYASMPAVRVSSAYVNSGAGRVDNVHTELCSFHLDKEFVNAEQIVMKTLFADGAIRYSLSGKDSFFQTKKDGLELLGQKEIIVPDTENEMSWKLGGYGFVMTLTRKVPILLSRKIEEFIEGLLKEATLNLRLDKDDIIFAIHPGGPKIIELVQRVLDLKPHQVKHSKEVLETRGNMSSATLPYIWKNIIDDINVKSKTVIVTVAFGPGLTMTGAVFRLCRQ